MVDTFKGLPQLGYTTGSNLPGVSTLLQRPNTAGVDFMAFARGQQMARDVGWQQQLRKQQELMLELQRQNWQDQLNERNTNLASSAALREMNRLRDSSGNLTDFYAGLSDNAQYQHILQNLPDAARGAVEESMRASQMDYALGLQQLGDREGYNQVMSSLGVPIGDQRQADLLDFNLPAAATAINARAGRNVMELTDDGQVLYEGTKITPGEFATIVASGELTTANLIAGLDRIKRAKDQRAGQGLNAMVQQMNPGFAGPQSAAPQVVDPTGLSFQSQPTALESGAPSGDPFQGMEQLQQSPTAGASPGIRAADPAQEDFAMLVAASQDPEQLAALNSEQLLQAQTVLSSLLSRNISPEERSHVFRALDNIREAQAGKARQALTDTWEGFKGWFRGPAPTEQEAEWLQSLRNMQQGGAR